MPRQDPPLVFTAQSKRYFYCREAVCEFAFARGVVPFHPFMAFGFFLGDRTDRDMVRRANNAALRRCDALWVFGRELANGVLKEIIAAADADIPVRFFTVEDRPEHIEELHPSGLRFEDEVRNATGRTTEVLLNDLLEYLPEPTRHADGRSLAFDF